MDPFLTSIVCNARPSTLGGRSSRAPRTAAAAIALGCLLTGGCTPRRAPQPESAVPVPSDTLYGWLQMVWTGAGGAVSYMLTDTTGQTTPLQMSDSLATAADARALDRGWVRVIVDRPLQRGSVNVRAITPAPRRPRA